MKRKDKSLEDLDAEIARLEAELSALGKGGAAEPPAPAKRRGLSFGRARGDAASEPPAEDPAPSPPASPAKGFFAKIPIAKIPRAKKAGAPAADARQPPAASALPPTSGASWDKSGRTWKRTAPDQKPVYVRRVVDPSGEVREEPADAVALGLAPAPRRVFGFGRGREEPPPSDPAAGPTPANGARRRWIVPAAIVVVALLAGAALLGSGYLGGVGSDAAQAPVVALSATGGVLDADARTLRALSGRAVVLDAAGTADPSRTGVSYHWDFGDGRSGTGESVQHTWTSPGTYTLTLTARNERGSTVRAIDVTVISLTPRFAMLVNDTPVSDANPVFRGDTVRLDATTSTVPTGTTYAWRIDGVAPRQSGPSVPSGATTQFAPSAPGLFSVRLVVTEPAGVSAETTAVLVVNQRLPDDFVMANTTTESRSVNRTFVLFSDAQIVPARVRITLEFSSNVSAGGSPLPDPGVLPVNPNNLTLHVHDENGNLVREDTSANAPKVMEIDNPAVAGRASWLAEVRRPPGGLEDQPFRLIIEIFYRAA
ncbi:MAG TPA: PKD domain-containing protein [Candidatus Thermoplasmatota archaeon]|nr:PKD domain-containing protein [Candidatus Thermoplasmatota archaeon]